MVQANKMTDIEKLRAEFHELVMGECPHETISHVGMGSSGMWKWDCADCPAFWLKERRSFDSIEGMKQLKAEYEAEIDLEAHPRYETDRALLFGMVVDNRLEIRFPFGDKRMAITYDDQGHSVCAENEDDNELAIMQAMVKLKESEG